MGPCFPVLIGRKLSSPFQTIMGGRGHVLILVHAGSMETPWRGCFGWGLLPTSVILPTLPLSWGQGGCYSFFSPPLCRNRPAPLASFILFVHEVFFGGYRGTTLSDTQELVLVLQSESLLEALKGPMGCQNRIWVGSIKTNVLPTVLLLFWPQPSHFEEIHGIVYNLVEFW